jgi:hypothetical protein
LIFQDKTDDFLLQQLTADLGGTTSTKEFTRAVIELLD